MNPVNLSPLLVPMTASDVLFLSAMRMRSEIFKNVMSMMTFASSCDPYCVFGILIGVAPSKGFDEKGERLVLVCATYSVKIIIPLNGV